MLVRLLCSRIGRNKAAGLVKAETRFKEVLRRSLGNLFKHCLEFYLDTRGFFPKNLFNHSVRGSRSLPKIGLFHSSLLQRRMNFLGPPKKFLWANRDIFAWQHATCFGPLKEFLRANQDICAWQHTTCLGPPKEFLWASRVILAQQLLL
jgi:hypothetical protein